MKHRLKKLKWEEISGVDAGANETPGWLLEKSKELGDQAQAFEKAVVSAAEAIDTDEVSLYFKGADEDVVKALETVRKHFQDGIEDEDEGKEPDPITEGAVNKLISLFKGRSDSDSEEKDEEKTEKSEDKEDEKDESTEKSEDKDESTEKSEDKEDESTEKSEEKSDEDESTEKSKDSDGLDVEKLAKAVGDGVNEELEPIRKAILGLAERMENVEKGTARSAGLEGQEGSENDKDEKSEKTSSVGKAITSALLNPGKKVTMK